MNLIEACKEMEKGKKVTHKSWEKNTYIYKNGIYLNFCDCTEMSKVRKEYYINDINLILSSDWEIFKDEKEILNKKGKLFDIAKYCENSSCVDCILREKDECDSGCVIAGNYQRLETMLLDDNFHLDKWSDEYTDRLYKLIKEEV